MSDRWSEGADVLIHEDDRSIGWVVAVVVVAGVVWLVAARWPVGVIGALMLWSIVGLYLLSFVRSATFDRQRNIVRLRGVLGRTWTESLDRFARVHVVRARSARGYPQIRVNLRRGGATGSRDS